MLPPPRKANRTLPPPDDPAGRGAAPARSSRRLLGRPIA